MTGIAPTLTRARSTRSPIPSLAPTSSLPSPTGVPILLPTLPGWPAANFDLPALNTNANRLSLLDLRGKPLLLGFFATWCFPCRYEIPGIIAAYQEHMDQMQFVYVDMKEAEGVVQAFIQKMSIPYPVVLDYDSEVARSYRVQSVPTTFFIDSKGRIVNVYLGVMTPDILETHILKLQGH